MCRNNDKQIESADGNLKNRVEAENWSTCTNGSSDSNQRHGIRSNGCPQRLQVS
jgi:hypothetical protein